MKKFLYWTFGILWALGGIYVDYQLHLSVKELKRQNQILIEANHTLSEGLSQLADKIIEKGEWDKKVAEKIRELDSAVKTSYGQTNQIIPEAVR